jgi:hypothetical protein
MVTLATSIPWRPGRPLRPYRRRLNGFEISFYLNQSTHIATLDIDNATDQKFDFNGAQAIARTFPIPKTSAPNNTDRRLRYTWVAPTPIQLPMKGIK